MVWNFGLRGMHLGARVPALVLHSTRFLQTTLNFLNPKPLNPAPSWEAVAPQLRSFFEVLGRLFDTGHGLSCFRLSVVIFFSGVGEALLMFINHRDFSPGFQAGSRLVGFRILVQRSP